MSDIKSYKVTLDCSTHIWNDFYTFFLIRKVESRGAEKFVTDMEVRVVFANFEFVALLMRRFAFDVRVHSFRVIILCNFRESAAAWYLR